MLYINQQVDYTSKDKFSSSYRNNNLVNELHVLAFNVCWCFVWQVWWRAMPAVSRRTWRPAATPREHSPRKRWRCWTAPRPSTPDTRLCTSPYGTSTHTHAHALTHTHMHTRAHAHLRTLTRTHTLTRTYTLTRRYTHTRTRSWQVR